MAPRLPMLSPCSTVPGQDVGDRLDAAVRMPREAGQVILRNVVAEVVQQQERIEVGRVAEAERAAQMHARAFEGRLGFDQPLNRSNGHDGLLYSESSANIWSILTSPQAS